MMLLYFFGATPTLDLVFVVNHNAVWYDRAMKNRPNVLLITVDHWPGSLLGSEGHPTILTPTLDRFAESGTRFTRAYSECPVCIPARRTLVTGTAPRTHGDRVFNWKMEMPNIPTVAQCFRDAGYQAFASGKLHVFPERDRIGFDDVMLCEDGRTGFGTDDYEIYLAEQGYAGAQFLHGMGTNEYVHRPWHLPEEHHPTNWITREMCRYIKRRNPTRPGFYYLSYTHPHPPLTPPEWYLNRYAEAHPPVPYIGEWAKDEHTLPFALKASRIRRPPAWTHDDEILWARRAFYALCTHIDHQIRVVIGTLREEKLLNDTVILFTSDHGDMLGNHGQWAKRLFYEDSARVPLILVPAVGDDRVGTGEVSNRLVGLQDVMPTLLDLAGIPVPGSVDGESVVDGAGRDTLYGEYAEDGTATRMIHDGRYKLIYYPYGNRNQLFNLDRDPHELMDLSTSAEHGEILSSLTESLVGDMYGSDAAWIRDGQLIGAEEPALKARAPRDLSHQRGVHWPVPPATP
jgi:arylsulfatase A-like enzyme